MKKCPKCGGEMIKSGSDLEVMYKGGPYGVIAYLCSNCKYVEFYGDVKTD